MAKFYGNENNYGVLYRVLKVADNRYLLFPLSFENGVLSDDCRYFQSDDITTPVLSSASSLEENGYVVCNFTTVDKDETDLVNPLFSELEEQIYLINTDDGIKLYPIDLKDNCYECVKPIIDNGLTADMIYQALCDSLCHDIFVNLFSKLIDFINQYNENKDDLEENESINVQPSDEEEQEFLRREDVSYIGLRDAIKEKIFGNDEAIETFAQNLYMNYTAEEGETVEPMLLVGPTGTGKTGTVRAAGEYLRLPYFEANDSNIKEICIGDILDNLTDQADGNIKLAQRGIVFFDDYDRLLLSALDMKDSVKQLDGSIVPVNYGDKELYFDTDMLNKIYAGVFESNDRAMGFSTFDGELLGTDQEIRDKLISKGYFTLNELSRFGTILGYNELSRDVKRQALLLSKLSELVKKRERYKRQFGIDLVIDDDFIEGILDSIPKNAPGIRVVNNAVKRSITQAERAILENEDKGYKKLVLKRDTVDNPSKFDLS